MLLRKALSYWSKFPIAGSNFMNETFSIENDQFLDPNDRFMKTPFSLKTVTVIKCKSTSRKNQTLPSPLFEAASCTNFNCKFYITRHNHTVSTRKKHSSTR